MRNVLARTHGHDILVSVLDLAKHLLELSHSVLVDFMREHDGAFTAGLVKDLLVILVNLLRGLVARRGNVPIVRVLLPQDGAQPEACSNRTHAVVRIAERRTPTRRCDTSGDLDSLGGVIQLGKHLLIRERRHVAVRPRVHTDVVAVDNPTLRLERPVDDIGPNVEHGSLEVILLQEVVEGIVRAVWSVVKGQAPRVGLWALIQILGDVAVLGLLAARRGPPAVGVAVRIVRRVVHAVVWSQSKGDTYVGRPCCPASPAHRRE